MITKITFSHLIYLCSQLSNHVSSDVATSDVATSDVATSDTPGYVRAFLIAVIIE